MPPTAPLRAPEEKLARAGALGAAVAALPATAIASVTHGSGVAVLVGAGALLVAVLALAALPLYKLAAAAGDQMIVAMSMAALGLRMLLALATFAGLRFATDVDMAPFAIGLAVGLMASIAAEMAAASRDPRLFFVQTPSRPTPSATAPAPAATTRSETERQLT